MFLYAFLYLCAFCFSSPFCFFFFFALIAGVRFRGGPPQGCTYIYVYMLYTYTVLQLTTVSREIYVLTEESTREKISEIEIGLDELYLCLYESGFIILIFVSICISFFFSYWAYAYAQLTFFFFSPFNVLTQGYMCIHV